jgi:hypothetical protein
MTAASRIRAGSEAGCLKGERLGGAYSEARARVTRNVRGGCALTGEVGQGEGDGIITMKRGGGIRVLRLDRLTTLENRGNNSL